MYNHSFSAEYDVARRLAIAAGAVVMSHYGKVEAEDTSSPVTIADRESNQLIVEGLRRAFPGDGVLSEELADNLDRLSRDRLWIVDPLDGTKEFLSGNGEFSVMIGLAVATTPVIGVVYVPERGTLYGAAWGAGAWIEENGAVRPLKAAPPSSESYRLVCSRSHADALLMRIRDELDVGETRSAGSVGVKCGMIAEGLSDLYVHPVPYLKEWDCCAPDLILREAGGTVTDCYGEPLRYNKRPPVQPYGFLGCAPGVLENVLPRITPLFAAEHAPKREAVDVTSGLEILP